jgi:hypothetical protein
MTQQDEKKWRELCNQAIAEKDLDKLLSLWMSLSRVMEEEQKQLTSGLWFLSK